MSHQLLLVLLFSVCVAGTGCQSSSEASKGGENAGTSQCIEMIIAGQRRMKLPNRVKEYVSDSRLGTSEELLNVECAIRGDQWKVVASDHVRLKNRDITVRLDRDGEIWGVRDLCDVWEEAPKHTAEYNSTVLPLLNSCRYIGHMPFEDFAQLSCVEILSCTTLESGDIAISFTCRDTSCDDGRLLLFREGEVVFAAEADFAIKSLKALRHNGQKIDVSYDKPEKVGGKFSSCYPSATGVTVNPNGDEIRTEWRNEVLFTEVLDSEFQLSQFGLIDPPSKRFNIWSSPVFYCVLAGLAAIGLAKWGRSGLNRE